MPMTSSPRSSRRSDSAEPMKPADPVINTFIIPVAPNVRLTYSRPSHPVRRQQVLDVVEHAVWLAQRAQTGSTQLGEIAVADCHDHCIVQALLRLFDQLDTVLLP